MSTFDEVQKLLKLEQTFNTNKYKFKSIELWPLVRENFLNQFILKINGSRPKNAKSKKLRLSLIILHFKIILNRRFKIQKFYKNLDSSNFDFFFLSFTSNYIKNLNGKHYDRFLDPYIDLINDRYSWKKVVLNDSCPDLNPNYNFETIDCSIIKEYVFSIFFFLDSFLINRKIKLIQNELNIKINSAHFSNKFSEIIAHYKLFSKIFKKNKPKLAMFIAYYSTECFGLILAAKKHGIKTVEIQHGKNGKYNHMLSHLFRFPSDGFKLLPDFFFTWGDSFSSEISKYYPPFLSTHYPVSIGNLSMSKSISWDQGNINNEELIFFNSIDKNKTVLLYSTQPLFENDVIPDWIAEFALSSNKYFWLFRIHPSQHIKDINWKGLDKSKNVDINYSSRISLINLFRYVDIHVSLWSSVCIDALQFQIKSIVIHPEGHKIYEEYIKMDYFVYCNNNSEFDNCVKKLIKQNVLIDSQMILDEDIIRKNFYNFLNSINFKN